MSALLLGAEAGNLGLRLPLSVQTPFTSLTFRHLAPTDAPHQDADGDGLTLEQELFFLRTDPYNADTDYDGLDDNEEVTVYGTDPLNAYSHAGVLPDGLAVKAGGLDPFSVPAGSTNSVLEHLFYSGTTNGTVVLPTSSSASAVLSVTVSGTGVGRLIVGNQVVPLLGTPKTRGAAATSFLVRLPKGVAHRLFILGDETLHVELRSDDFGFGALPAPGDKGAIKEIFFPDTVATVPCIHDYGADVSRVELKAPREAKSLTAHWTSEKVKVENIYPRSALLSGRLSPKENPQLSYTLTHPQYLFGKRVFDQSVRFCPPMTEETVPQWYDDRQLGTTGREGVEEDLCWCCRWRLCERGCTCACICIKLGSRPAENRPVIEENLCPEHRTPYAACAAEHDAAYDQAAQTYERHKEILYLRTPPGYETLVLDVPPAPVRCCPCPEHWTNYVALAYRSSHLSVVDQTGAHFRQSTTSCVVRVAGVSPSLSAGDAKMAFTRNGQLYLQHEKTVLGVGIAGEGEAYNALNMNFGYPISVGPDQPEKSALRLVTNVCLPDGKIHLSFRETSGQFTLWYFDRKAKTFRRLLESGSFPSMNMDLSAWRSVIRGAHDWESADLSVYLTSRAPGTTKLVFRYWNVLQGRFVEDTALQRITSVRPPLLADMNHDGKITDQDIADVAQGKLFRFWINEETVRGDFNDGATFSTGNSYDEEVNGRYDLVNLFPVKLDLGAFISAWGRNISIELSARGGALRYCALDLAPENALAMQREEVLTRGEAPTPLHQAKLTTLSQSGTALDLTQTLGSGMSSGLLAFEAEQAGDVMLAIKKEGKTLFTSSLALSLSSVEAMYRWLNLRSHCGDNRGELSRLEDPPNYPDAACDNRHFVFVHGYNVNCHDARVWASAIFKRLWWAGSKSRFTAVDWYGDQSQKYFPFLGDISPDYYINVKHAFLTAGPAAQILNEMPGEKILLAHSLGNMLVSSAVKDHNLNYAKYYLLNAAVAMEAYDERVIDPLMIDGAWTNIPEKFRASRYSDQFAQTADDFRLGLSWKGRFAGLKNTVNCYSLTEDVLANPTEVKVFGLKVGEGFGDAWAKQELFKGCSLWYGVNPVTFSGVEIEGGWGVNARYVANPLAYLPFAGFLPSYFENYTREEMITKPLFTSLNEAYLHETNLCAKVDAELCAKILGDAIPAESFAAGANETSGMTENYNMQTKILGVWPRRKDDKNIWLHSDLKNIAFCFVFPLFEKFVKENPQ